VLLGLDAFSSWSPRTSSAIRPAPRRSRGRRGDHQGLDGALDGLAELLDQVGDGLGVRRVDHARLLGGRRGLPRPAPGLGQLDVGGVVAVGGEGDGVLAGVGEHVELVRGVAADAAGVGLHGRKSSPQRRKMRL
jgi:hypothetical protein